MAVLTNISNPLNRVNLDVAHRAAETLSVTIEAFEVQSGRDVEGALRKLIDARPDAALLASDTSLLTERKLIAETMAANRIPAIYPFREYLEVGGFIFYGANLSILFEQAAGYVDKLLQGEQLGSLPVQQATRFEVVINLKAATALNLIIPPIVLVRANEVIE